jgi:hypothetical protein
MRFTSPENIIKSEKLLIDTINAELNMETIKKFLLEKHKLTLQEEIDYKDGDLVVHNDAVAYKFNFEVKVPFSVIFDRQGECLDIAALSDIFKKENKEEIFAKEEIIKDKKSVTDEKVEQMASNIADMISEINEGDE